MHLGWCDFCLRGVCLATVALPAPSPSHMRCRCHPVLPQVDAFYNFWYSFKSWREFPHPDEEDIEQARGWGGSPPALRTARLPLAGAFLCTPAAVVICTCTNGMLSTPSNLLSVGAQPFNWPAGRVSGAPPLD